MSSKSSKGVVIYAKNGMTNEGKYLRYIEAAAQTARGVRAYLNVPVTLLTTDTVDGREFDSVVYVPQRDKSHRVMVSSKETITYAWDNDHRIDAIDYSPYERTLLIDADYFVFSDRLKSWLDADNEDYPFIIMQQAWDITDRDIYKNTHYLADQSIPQVWATAMCWGGAGAKPYFEAARMVRDNYEMYAALTGTPATPFRNDVAFSIAAHMLGYTGRIPPMQTLPPDSSIIGYSKETKRLALEYPNKNGGWGLLSWQGRDLHVINKNVLYDPNVLALVKEYYDNVLV